MTSAWETEERARKKLQLMGRLPVRRLDEIDAVSGNAALVIC